jgi:TolB-like protein
MYRMVPFPPRYGTLENPQITARDVGRGRIMGSARINVIGTQGPTAEEICRQLERILGSEEFHSPDRGRKFLQFIVDETLAGRSEFLKAFTIANQVFGREVSFDAQNDPVVRIEAGRIRRALERYYLISGQADTVTITIPKGRYVPHFEYSGGLQTHVLPAPGSDVAEGVQPIDHAQPSARLGQLQLRVLLALGTALAIGAGSFSVFHASAPPISQASIPETPIGEAFQPKVTIESFENSGPADIASDFAHGLRSEVIGQLAKFADIVVIADPSKTNQQDPTGYALQGNVQFDGNRIRSIVRLVRQSDGVVIWANNYDADLRARNKLDIQADVAEQIASAIAQPYDANISNGHRYHRSTTPGGETMTSMPVH